MIGMIGLAVALQVIGSAVPPAAPVEAVAADPERFRARRVQVHGWLERCSYGGHGCVLTVGPSGGGGMLSIEGGAATLRMLDQWAPAQVTLEARVVGERSRRTSMLGFNDILFVEQAAALRDVRLHRVLREGRPAGSQGE